jgi:hypothetical protein
LLDETKNHAPIGGDQMRLINRSRRPRRGKPPRIAISQAEITADLYYPDSREEGRRTRALEARPGGGR